VESEALSAKAMPKRLKLLKATQVIKRQMSFYNVVDTTVIDRYKIIYRDIRTNDSPLDYYTRKRRRRGILV
jgi:hypothetical protein